MQLPLRINKASALLLAAAAALCASPRAGAFTLVLQTNAGTTLVIPDNGPGDTEPMVGAIVFVGAVDAFTSIVATGLSKPVNGDATTGRLDLSVVSATGSSSGTLKVMLSDGGFGGPLGATTFESAIGGTTFGTTTFQGFVDTADVEFGISGPSVCTSGLQGPFGPGSFDSTATGACTVAGSFSMTLVASASIPQASTQSYGAYIEIVIPEEPIGCRFTGGGVDTNLDWNHELESGEMVRNGAGNLPSGIDRYQFGGQVGARTAQQPIPSGEWQHHQQTGPCGDFAFHGGSSSAPPGTRIVEVVCSDPGYCRQARPAPAKQLDFTAIGTFSNVGKGNKAPGFQIPDPNVVPEPQGKKGTFTYHWFEVNIDDLGEPGGLNSGAPNSTACPGRGFGEKSAGPFPDPAGPPGSIINLPYTELGNCDCPDFYRITIFKGVLAGDVTYLPDGSVDPDSLDRTHVIYEVYGYIDGGNLQIHPPTGYDSQ